MLGSMNVRFRQMPILTTLRFSFECQACCGQGNTRDQNKRNKIHQNVFPAHTFQKNAACQYHEETHRIKISELLQCFRHIFDRRNESREQYCRELERDNA